MFLRFKFRDITTELKGIFLIGGRFENFFEKIVMHFDKNLRKHISFSVVGGCQIFDSLLDFLLAIPIN